MAPVLETERVYLEIWLIVIALSFSLDIKVLITLPGVESFKSAEVLIMHRLTLIKTVLV